MPKIASLVMVAVSSAVVNAAELRFEVASIKPSAPDSSNRVGRHTGGPGTSDPGLFVVERYSIRGLIVLAYGLMPYEYSVPGWASSRLFDISARVPPETTKEDFQLMQQNLLVERFKLAFHREKREMQAFELVVAKNGAKLEESRDPIEPPTPLPKGQPVLDGDGFPILPPGRGWTMRATQDNHVAERFAGETMAAFVKMLPSLFHPAVPVFDETGLTGKYNFKLHWVFSWATPEQGGPSIFEGLEKQIGLKLLPKKRMVDIFVVDNIEKMPTEN